MPRVRGKSLCFIVGLVSICLTPFGFAQMQTDDSGAYLNMKQALHDRTKATKEGGRLDNFPKTIIDGNLYEHAHMMAEYQIAYPSASALDLTYEAISERCRGEYGLRSDHVTNVFANTVPGERLRDLMEARKSVDEIKQPDFDTSCIEVVKCYLRNEFESRGIDPATRNAYTHTTYTTCMNVVQDIYSTMIQRTAGIATMRNNNYGDDVFLNADPKDSPYDLLVDIERIADLLFVQNDPASEIHYYAAAPIDTYVDNDPDDLTYHETIDPIEQDRIERLPPTRGVPATKGEVTGIYPPVDEEEVFPRQPDEKQSQRGPAVGKQTGGSLGNIICEEPLPEDDQTKSETEQSEEQQEQTIDYNEKLSLDDRVAILLGSKMSEEMEELFGDDDIGNDPQWNEANAIVDDIVDLKGDALQQVKDHVEGCIAQFTENDPGQWRRILRKSISQPTEFTKCVFAGLCKEIGDPSGRGLYRIKICKEPRKGVGVISHKKVTSVEDVMDELLSACYGLKESGQLIEHNKTKDHMEHKLMRINIADKLSFGLSIIFKPIQDRLDPASVKRMMRENNAYLEDTILLVSDDLSFVNERNKYLLIHDSEESKSLLENGGALASLNKALVYSESLEREEEVVRREQRSQLVHYGQTLDLMADFVQQNIEMRRYANESMDAMKDIRTRKEEQFQASPGK